MDFLLDLIFNIDTQLADFITTYDQWIYVILFAIIFVETGLVIMPFLPGDSLLFAVGMFAAQGALDIYVCIVLLLIAAILGDACNYYIGKYLGEKIMNWRFRGKKIVKEEHLEKTHQFYDQHGSKTIIIARFVPFVRTFAPFVAGIGKMKYKTFFTFNVVGALLWVVGVTLLGYFLGNIPFIKDNFEKVVFIIIFISILPIIISFIKNKRAQRAQK